jgi:non-heme chloroperoxidase
MTGDDHSWLSDGYAAVSDDLTLYYQTAGCGAIGVIFVPGWTMASQVFEHQLRHLARSEQFTAAAYDPRAQGRSTITTNGHYYEQHAHDLRGLIEQLGFEQYVLIGWSAGGCEILEYLRLYGPDRLSGLALLDIPPKIRGRDRAAEWVEFGTGGDGDQDGLLKYFSYDVQVDRERINREFAEWMLDDPSPDKIKFFSQMSMGTPDAVTAVLNLSLWFLDNTEQVEKLNGKVPLLYYVRQELHERAWRWASEHTPDAVVESHGKHAMFWEHPAVFNAALDRFLRRVSPWQPAG